MKHINYKKLILPNIPYVFIALFATKIGQAARLAPGSDLSGKLLHIMQVKILLFVQKKHVLRPISLVKCSSENLLRRICTWMNMSIKMQTQLPQRNLPNSTYR